jgi:hypothetical protein
MLPLNANYDDLYLCLISTYAASQDNRSLAPSLCVTNAGSKSLRLKDKKRELKSRRVVAIASRFSLS